MKIAYVSANTWPGKSPGVSFSFFNARGFAQAGADFFCLIRGATSESVRKVTKELFCLDEEVPVVPLRAPRLAGARWLYFLKAYRHLLRSDRDVLITRSLNFLPWAISLRKRRNIRVYFESHNFWSDLSVRGGDVPASRSRKIRLEQKWVPRVDGIICVSEPQARLYRECYPDIPVICAVSGCKPARPPKRESFSYTLGYMGSLGEKKYPVSVVMEALSKVERPEIRFLCVGAKNEKTVKTLKDKADSLGVGDRVEVHPWLSGEALDEIKSRIDVGVAILSDSFVNRMASPMKVFEYISSSMPFIATRLEGIEFSVRDREHGLLVKNTPEEWSQVIREIYSDFSTYRRMAQNCYEFALKNGWKERALKIMQAVGPGESVESCEGGRT